MRLYVSFEWKIENRRGDHAAPVEALQVDRPRAIPFLVAEEQRPDLVKVQVSGIGDRHVQRRGDNLGQVVHVLEPINDEHLAIVGLVVPVERHFFAAVAEGLDLLAQVGGH